MSTDYTDKQLADHLARFQQDGTLPENSVFDPSAEARGGTILRKMTPEEIAATGRTPATAPATETKED